MAGGLPIMRAYRPTPKPSTSASVTIPTIAPFRPVLLNTASQRAAWIQESREWSRVLAQKIEQRQRRRPEAARGQDGRHNPLISRRQPEVAQGQIRANNPPTLRRQQEAQQPAQAQSRAETTEQTVSLACWKCVWWASVFGLIVSAVLLVILFTNLLREKEEARIGVSTVCDAVPSLTDGSKYIVVFWITVNIDIVSKVAMEAVAIVATLSKGLHKDDAPYWAELRDFSRIGMYLGILMALFPFNWLLNNLIDGECGGEICLNLGLATLAVVNWTSLASIVGFLFFKRGYEAMVGYWKDVSDMVWSKMQLRQSRGGIGQGFWG